MRLGMTFNGVAQSYAHGLHTLCYDYPLDPSKFPHDVTQELLLLSMSFGKVRLHRDINFVVSLLLAAVRVPLGLVYDLALLSVHVLKVFLNMAYDVL